MASAYCSPPSGLPICDHAAMLSHRILLLVNMLYSVLLLAPYLCIPYCAAAYRMLGDASMVMSLQRIRQYEDKNLLAAHVMVLLDRDHTQAQVRKTCHAFCIMWLLYSLPGRPGVKEQCCLCGNAKQTCNSFFCQKFPLQPLCCGHAVFFSTLKKYLSS